MTDLDGLHEYGYDTLYQIVRATHPTVTNPLEQFQYDAAGNRLADVYRAYSYNELNQLVEDDSATYAYDLDGNMVLKVSKGSGDSTKFSWDIENRLVRVVKPGVVAEYVYDALGRRVAKTVNGTRTEFRYDGEDLILTMDDAGTVTGSWTFGPAIDQPLAISQAGVMHYYLTDALGSVRALADSAGTVDQTYEYSVYGQLTKQTGSVENAFTYAAREWEAEVGLYYYRARWYEPTAGRFSQEDPWQLGGGDVNFYRYVRNRPVSLTDPLGLWSCALTVTGGIGRWGGSVSIAVTLSGQVYLTAGAGYGLGAGATLALSPQDPTEGIRARATATGGFAIGTIPFGGSASVVYDPSTDNAKVFVAGGIGFGAGTAYTVSGTVLLNPPGPMPRTPGGEIPFAADATAVNLGNLPGGETAPVDVRTRPALSARCPIPPAGCN